MPAVDDAEFVIEGKTVEEIGVRGREASIRLQAWGRRNGYREAAAREADLRMRLIVDLYHRDGITQQMIADMFGISPWRITQILNVHYERLHNERTAKKGRK
jgi:DNA-directed RNA polymerase specialized sigma subunit